MHDTPFGKAFIAVTLRGICSLAFLERAEVDDHLAGLQEKWPHAMVHENRKRTLVVNKAMFGEEKKLDRPVSCMFPERTFRSMWKALLQITQAMVASYSHVVTAIGHPSSARAVGLAVGANPAAFPICIPRH